MEEKKLNAYRNILKQTREGMEKVGQRLEPVLANAVDKVGEQGSEWAELGREELHRIADYLRRDLLDASLYMQKFGDDFKQWLGFEVSQAEMVMLDDFLKVADQTIIELDKINFDAGLQTWKSGEIIGVGTLRCTGCGEILHFTKPGHIPPCPKCHGSTFHKFWQ